MLGEIEPGATLTELEVAARFQCSQSTVREALFMLQQEGLVQRSPHRGTRVCSLTEDEAVEMLRLRRDMECRAAQRLFIRPARSASASAYSSSAAAAASMLANVEPLLLR